MSFLLILNLAPMALSESPMNCANLYSKIKLPQSQNTSGKSGFKHFDQAAGTWFKAAEEIPKTIATLPGKTAAAVKTGVEKTKKGVKDFFEPKSFDQSVKPVFSAAAKTHDALHKGLVGSAKYVRDVVRTGGLRFFFAKEKTGEVANATKQIWGGFFTLPEESKGIMNVLTRIGSGDTLAQAIPKLATKYFFGKAFEFTPSNFLANLTRGAPVEGPLNRGVTQELRRAGYVFSMPVNMVGNYIMVGIPAVHVINKAAYELIAEPQNEKRHEELEADREKWSDYILYNAEAEDILTTIAMREKIPPTMTIKDQAKVLRSKITHADLLAAQGKQRGILAAYNLIQKHLNEPIPFSEIEELLAIDDPRDALGPALRELKTYRKKLPSSLSEDQQKKVQTLFENRIKKTLAAASATLVLTEKWPLAIKKKEDDPDIDLNEQVDKSFAKTQDDKLKKSESSPLAKDVVRQFLAFGPLKTLRQIAKGEFNEPGGRKIIPEYNDLLTVNYYLQKFMADSWDAEFDRIRDDGTEEDFTKSFKARVENGMRDLFNRYYR